MVCSDFAVLRGNYILRKNKEISMNIFTGFIPPIHFKPPYNEHMWWKHIYIKDKHSGPIEPST